MTVTWADSPATSSPVDAANLDHLLQDDGSVTATAPTIVARALSGANKVFADFNATDGTHYQIYITTSGKLSVWDVTHGINCFEIAMNGGGITVNNVGIPQQGAHNSTAFTLSAGAGAPGTLNTGEIYFQLS